MPAVFQVVVLVPGPGPIAVKKRLNKLPLNQAISAARFRAELYPEEDIALLGPDKAVFSMKTGEVIGKLS